jgi:hypothetical protein
MSHPTPAPVRSLLHLTLMIVALAAAPCRAGASDLTLDPARVGWSEIRMTASKLFLTAQASVALRTVPGATVRADLLSTPVADFTPLAPGSDVLELVYDASGVGQKSRITLLMDPLSGAALQRTQHGQEGKLRFRTYRFGLEGAYQRTRRPANASETGLMPARWTDSSEGLRSYPQPPGTQPVIEGTGLLYTIAAAPLDTPGDAIELLVFRRHDTQAVRIEVLAPEEISVGYDELWPRGAVRRSGRIRALRLSLQGLPVAGGNAEDDELEVLGLKGRLELFLDPETRAPLQLSGTVKLLGTVTLKLGAVRLR